MLSEPSHDRISTTVRTARGSWPRALTDRLSKEQKPPRFFESVRASTETVPDQIARQRERRDWLGLLEAVLTVHAGALVHVGLGYVGASTTGDAFFDTLADKATHEKGATLYAPIGLGVPGDLLRVRQDVLSSSLRIYSTVGLLR